MAGRLSPPKALVLAAAAAAAVGMAGAAPASEMERIEPAFGNTILSTYPDGRTAALWLERDGTYTGRTRRGGSSTGRWMMRTDRLCLRQSRPIPAPFSFCTPIPASDKLDGWPAKAVTGEAIMVKIMPGAE